MNRGKRIRKTAGWRWLTALGMSLSLVAGIIVCDHASAQTTQTTKKSRTSTAQSALAKYARDFTADAEQGRFNSITERSDEVNRSIQILSRVRQNNPVVLTDSQAARDAIAAGVARRIATGDVPEALQGKRLLKLNLELLFHDSKTSAELVSTLNEILSDVAQSESKIIFLVDPVQSLVGNTAAFDGAASALLRDAIKNGDVQCLGASTDIIFQEHFASDETLAPLFARIEMQEVAETQLQSGNDEPVRAANSSAEDFVGDKVSDDLRELIESRNAPTHVKAILQVNDANSSALRAQLAEYGVTIDARMARFGRESWVLLFG